MATVPVTSVTLQFRLPLRRQGEAMHAMNVRKLKDGLDYLASKASPAVAAEVGEVDEKSLTAVVLLIGAQASDVAGLVAGTGLTVVKTEESAVDVVEPASPEPAVEPVSPEPASKPAVAPRAPSRRRS